MSYQVIPCVDDQGRQLPYGVIPVNPNVASVVPLSAHASAHASAHTTVDMVPTNGCYRGPQNVLMPEPADDKNKGSVTGALCLVAIVGTALIWATGSSGQNQADIDRAVLQNTIQIQEQRIRDLEMQQLGAAQGK